METLFLLSFGLANAFENACTVVNAESREDKQIRNNITRNTFKKIDIQPLELLYTSIENKKKIK